MVDVPTGHPKIESGTGTVVDSRTGAREGVGRLHAGGCRPRRRLGVVAALVLSAQAAMMGTRFVCSEESRASRKYKERIVRAHAEGA